MFGNCLISTTIVQDNEWNIIQRFAIEVIGVDKKVINAHGS